ncbi:PREDICTED: uncharacterized protein LOC105150458 isoform X2 [Acromyrmex echinatior]|uniref:uncharacterized protein LOC105150458 isoform X2 n=1 Tax=Acromyrmex echinatior TaxID=103372 RepID=UPI000580F245|nr:PREDICTED: uncharacterized protein LOC105150458 isoform X2 [Acromyrmex echinatior]
MASLKYVVFSLLIVMLALHYAESMTVSSQDEIDEIKKSLKNPIKSTPKPEDSGKSSECSSSKSNEEIKHKKMEPDTQCESGNTEKPNVKNDGKDKGDKDDLKNDLKSK